MVDQSVNQLGKGGILGQQITDDGDLSKPVEPRKVVVVVAVVVVIDVGGGRDGQESSEG